MSITPKPDVDLKQVIDKLNKRITALEQSNPLQGGAVISGGGLTGVDPTSGRRTFFEGLTDMNDGSGRKQMAFYLNRNDGTLALALADLGTINGHTFLQSLQIFDRQGNVVVADDTNGGVGLAEPQIPIGYFSDIGAASIASTTSATYADLQWCTSRRQHPKVRAGILVYSSVAGTTGNVQIVDGAGNVIGAPIAVTSLEFGLVTLGPVAWPGGTWAWNEGLSLLKLQAERTAGTGVIGARVLGIWGEGS